MRRLLPLPISVAAAAVALGGTAPAADTQAASRGCVMAIEARVLPAGDASGGPLRFTRAFHRLSLRLSVSTDGLEGGHDIPISIEEVCGVPARFANQAMRLIGADGVAVIYQRTEVRQGRMRLRGAAARRAIAEADTADLRVRLASRRSWRRDEDGNRVPTFRTQRIRITD